MLWNEPNNLSHWDRYQDPEWGLFAEMIGLAGERLAHISPGLPRVLGGISPSSDTSAGTAISDQDSFLRSI